MSRLIAWKTPFASASFPSISVSVERILRDTVVLVDADQRWELRFGYVTGLKVCDESYDENTRFHLDRDVQDLCSYFWDDSPWLNEFNMEHVEAVENGKLKHYVLLGGDCNVEVLALGDVEIKPANM